MKTYQKSEDAIWDMCFPMAPRVAEACGIASMRHHCDSYIATTWQQKVTTIISTSWRMIEGNDRGTSYRSAIYYVNDTGQSMTSRRKAALQSSVSIRNDVAVPAPVPADSIGSLPQTLPVACGCSLRSIVNRPGVSILGDVPKWHPDRDAAIAAA